METLNRFIDAIVNPVIVVLFALAGLYFIFGVVKYLRNAESPEARENGARHVLWAIIGLAIMGSVWGIMAIIKATLGAE